MSLVKRRLHNESYESLWSQHEQTLRQLYEAERKTLKQVKAIMESEHDFPELPLSIYETRLRDGLRLRKKFNNSDWPIIYEHFHKRKEKGKESRVYLHQVQIPPNKVWKEIRRSGKREAYRGQHSPRSLPAHITVRTPSPTPQSIATVEMLDLPTSLSSNPIPAPLASLLSSLPAKREHLSTIPGWLLSMPYNGPLPEETLEEYSGWVLRLSLESIPIRDFLIKGSSFLSQNTRNSEFPNEDGNEQQESYTLQPTAPKLDVYLTNVPFRGMQRFSFLDLFYQSPQDSAVVRNFDAFHFLARVIYLLSNQLQTSEDGDLLELIVTRIPRKVLKGLFSIDTPSVRSAWYSLVDLAHETSHRIAFTMLMTIGLEHHEWIRPYWKRYLAFAASMGCISIVRRIVISSDWPDRGDEESYAVIRALENGNTECARLVVEVLDADYSSEVTTTRSPKQSCFEYLLSRYVNSKSARVASDRRVYNQGLQMFLDSGVEVGLMWTRSSQCDRYDLQRMKILHDANYENDRRHLTLAEACFYLDEALFEKLQGHGSLSHWATDVSRHGICLAARHGKDALDQYLRSRSASSSEEVTKFLQLVLAEQFILGARKLDIQAVNGLVAYGVDIALPALKTEVTGEKVDASFLTGQLVKNMSKHGFGEEAQALLNLLLSTGGRVNAYMLKAAVTTKEALPVLRVLVSHAPNIAQDGTLALAAAAREDDFGMVDWLLGTGVDINADIYLYNGEWRSVLAAACGSCQHLLGPSSASVAMLQHLMERGAKMRVNRDDEDPAHFMAYILRKHPDGDESRLMDKIRLFLDSGINLRAASGDLLEACLIEIEQKDETPRPRLEIFEFLYRQGAPIRPGCPLAMLIYKGGRRDLIQELIDAGADINAYSGESFSGWHVCLTPLQAAASRADEDLIRDLYDRGANINAPANGMRGHTALQAACDWSPLSAEEVTRQRNTIRFLIEQRADVNAPPGGGFTALQHAAIRGDIETAGLLLRYGANVNATPCTSFSKNALDLAAGSGRLDMVKLLLNEGARSYDEGSTGFDGAIEAAKEERYFGVADLIRDHVADISRDKERVIQ